MITITLRGDPGMRTGTVQIETGILELDYMWNLATWHRQAGGEVHSTTDDGVRVKLALDAGTGGITIGADWWALSGCKWTCAVMTGTATPGDPVTRMMRVSDAEMVNMFPDCGWEA